MKRFTQLKKYGPRLALVPLAGLGATAHAALPTGVSEAITAAQTDMTTAIGLVIAAMVVVWGLWKLGKKLGWL